MKFYWYSFSNNSGKIWRCRPRIGDECISIYIPKGFALKSDFCKNVFGCDGICMKRTKYENILKAGGGHYEEKWNVSGVLPLIYEFSEVEDS